jgi:hypothetical protein
MHLLFQSDSTFGKPDGRRHYAFILPAEKLAALRLRFDFPKRRPR